MNRSRIFIFEFVSGGGFNQVQIPSSLFCEGYGMLRAIIADFKAMDFEITTLLDERISFLSQYLETDSLQCIKASDNFMNVFKASVKNCDSAFIIAPEFSNILYDLTKIVKKEHKKLLSTGLKGIELGSSKIKTYKHFRNHYINTPKTCPLPSIDDLDINFIIQIFEDFNSPIIIKPLDGVGAESIYLFEKKNQILNFFKEVSTQNINLNRKFIAQEYIEGVDLSVSLVGPPFNKKNPPIPPLILGINNQDINIKNSKGDSEYFGGYTPVENYVQIKNMLIKTFEKLDLSMYNSYFGIDFILTQDSLYFIEINPRLTTSYIGIRNILNVNPVELILNYSSKFPDFKEPEIQAHSIFKRVELEYVGEKSINEINKSVIPKLLIEIPEFITPPITFTKSNQTKKCDFSCFIATKEKDKTDSQNRFARINEVLKEKYDFSLIK
jgi:predicted ATP-grasp superfamily ATP-dependent carboligase